MTGFRTRKELLAWLDCNAPSKTFKRALQSGKPVVLLGAFKPLPNSTYPGWIVQAATQFREYYVAVSIRPDGKCNAYMVDYIDWKCYDGSESTSPLYAGDRQDRAVALKQAEKFEVVGGNDE